MYISIVLLIAGFLLLIVGANWLVTGATVLAKRFNVSDLVIGLTIVAFGTSAPELIVSVIASSDALPDIAFGNVIGSNIFNLFVILGITGLIAPLKVQSETVKMEIPISFLAALLLLFLSNNFFNNTPAVLSRIDGIILLICFGCFLYYVFRMLPGSQSVNVSKNAEINVKMYKIVLLLAAGLSSLVIGGNLMLQNAVEIAQTLGVSEKIIGLTIVAAGTSLPELATSVVAAIRKNNDIAVGNIIGSNIFNILMILGLSAVVRPLPFDNNFNMDILLLLVGTVLLLLAMFTGKKRSLDRWEALLFLGIYGGYLFYMLLN